MIEGLEWTSVAERIDGKAALNLIRRAYPRTGMAERDARHRAVSVKRRSRPGA
jgi:hypothetical protein